MFYYDPQQELFSTIKTELENKGYSVFDGALPPENTPYPFIYLGDMQQLDDNTKNATLGTIHQTIHVWSNTPKNRGSVSSMLLDIKMTCRLIEHTQHYGFYLKNATQRILSDNTTKTPLLHGVIELEFKMKGVIQK